MVEAKGDAEHGLLVAQIYRGTTELRPVIEAMLDIHPLTGQRTGRRVPRQPDDHRYENGGPAPDLNHDRPHPGARTPPVNPSTPLLTRDFVRPRWSNGELVLHVQPAIGGQPGPLGDTESTPGCADHA